MTNLNDGAADGEYARLFRLLSTVNKDAEALQLSSIVHLTNMALLQLTLDWEGVRPENERLAKINAIFRDKTRVAMSEDTRQ